MRRSTAPKLTTLALLLGLVAMGGACSDDPAAKGEPDAAISSDATAPDDATDTSPPEEVSGDTTPPSDVVSLAIAGGDLQVGTVGAALAPLQVLVTDGAGDPLGGVTLSFQVSTAAAAAGTPSDEGLVAATATLEAESVTSGDDGIASTGVTLGDDHGGVVVTVRPTSHRAAPVEFHLWAYPVLGATEVALSVVSFNDFHMHFEPWSDAAHPKGGLARLVELLGALREANDEAGISTVVFNAGDDFENTFFHDQPGAFEDLLRTWDTVGVDFLQMGNHESHFGVPFVTDRILTAAEGFSDGVKGHPMTITWGNVDPSSLFAHVAEYGAFFETDFADTDDELLYQQTATLTKGPLTIGVMGLVTDAAIYTQVPGNPSFFALIGAQSPDAQGLGFVDPDPQASSYVGDAIDALDAGGADIIIANSHAGLGFGDRVNIPPGKDELVAAYGLGTTSGRPVDLIVSGHSHVKLNHALLLDNAAGGTTAVVQALEGGLYVARVDLVIDTATDEVTLIDSRLLQVDGTWGEDEATAAMVQGYADAIAEAHPDWKEPLAQSDTLLSSRERTYSGMGKLINEAILHSVTTDPGGEDWLSFVVPSTYRHDIPPGPIDLDLVYKVLSMHEMDAEGLTPDSIAYVTVQPGLYDMSLMGMEATTKENVTILEYVLETVHSLVDVLGTVMPQAADDLSLDLVQLAGVSYAVDETAPPFQRVVPGSLTVLGAPVDPTKTYRIASAHSIISTLARMLDQLVIAKDHETGAPVTSVLVADEETDEAFSETGIPLWQSLYEYLGATYEPDEALPTELVTVTGELFRSTAPDLTVNPADIALSATSAAPGDELTATVTVRNLGLAPVAVASVRLYLEGTPWDGTDDPDGFEHLEGHDDGYLGGLQLMGETTLAVQAYPETAEASFSFDLPGELPPWTYPVIVHVEPVAIEALDPNTGEPYLELSAFNNKGLQRSVPLSIE